MSNVLDDEKQQQIRALVCLGWTLSRIPADARVAVDDSAMRAALRTGLFNARGADCFGFAHKTYGEFLTARFIARLQLPLPQIKSSSGRCSPDAVEWFSF